MHEWLVLPDFGALAHGHHFAAGAFTVALLQSVIVACADRLARRRVWRTQFPPRDPSRMWAELRQLRADCATSAGNLETAFAQLKEKAMAHMVERGSSAHQLERLQRTLEEKLSIIDMLERRKAELELLKEQHLLELNRKDEELRISSEALANAERTIVLLRGVLARPAAALPLSLPQRVAV